MNIDAVIPTAKEVQRKSLLDSIYSLLNECSDKEKDFFNRLYQNGSIENESLENIISAYELCRRTVLKKMINNLKGKL